MLTDFLKIINSDQTKSFLETAIPILYHEDYPFCSYLGINYSDEKLLNVKFYLTAFKKIDFELIEQFFPHSTSIKDYYAEYRESCVYNYKNMGLSFALKLDIEGNTKHGFCMRVKSKMNPSISNVDLFTENHDVDDYFAIESSELRTVYPKYYYTFVNKSNVETLLRKFNLPFDSDKVEVVEFASFDGKEKLLAALSNVADVETYLQNNESDNFLKLHEFIKSKFNFIPASPGGYLNGKIRSIYYFDQGTPVYFRDSYTLSNLLESLKSGDIRQYE